MRPNLIRLLKHCVTLFCLTLLVSTCERDPVVEPVPQEPNFAEKLSFEQLQSDQKFSEAFKSFKLNTVDKKFNKAPSVFQETEDYAPGFSIDLNTIVKIEKDHATTYTFVIEDDSDLPPYAFKNLVLEVTEQHTHGYFITYYPTQNYIRNKIFDDNAEFETHISVTPFEEDVEALLDYIKQSPTPSSDKATTSYDSSCQRYYVIETMCAANKHWPGESCQLTGSQRAQSYYFLVFDDGCYDGSGGGSSFVGPPINLDGDQNISSGSGLGGSSNPPGFHSGSTIPNTPAGIGGINHNLLQTLLNFEPYGYYAKSHYFNYLRNVSRFANSTGALDLGSLLYNYGSNSALSNAQLAQVTQKAKEILAIMAKNNFVGIDQYTTTEQEVIARNSLFIGFLPSVNILQNYWPRSDEEWATIGALFAQFLPELALGFVPGSSIVDVVKGAQEGSVVAVSLGIAGVIVDAFGASVFKGLSKVIKISEKVFKIFRLTYQVSSTVGRGLKAGLKASLSGTTLILKKNGIEVARIAQNIITFKYSGFGGNIVSTANKTTTVIGKWTNQLENIWKTGLAKQGPNKRGLNIFGNPPTGTPEEVWAANKQWLNNAIARGDVIRVTADPLDINNVFYDISDINPTVFSNIDVLRNYLLSLNNQQISQLGYYGREIRHLFQKEYLFDSTTKQFIK